MSKTIKQIPFWGVFTDCFPELIEIYVDQDESKITDSQWLEIARWWRNALLFESDWSQVSDNSLTLEKREEWRQYRETLRTITDLYNDPKEIVFPDLPSK
jgi:hypothetical protein